MSKTANNMDNPLSDQLLVSIITVSFNGEDTIARTIESVLGQTYQNIEYILIDGASTDRTVEIAESFRARFGEKNMPFTVISEPDKGMYDALNKGTRAAHGELVGQINSDDWYEPDAVETMVNLYKEKNYDVAWGSIEIVKISGNIVKHAKIGKLWTTTHWCHPGMFSKREILLEYPYALESMYDDFDYITAVHKAGKNIVTIDHLISHFTFGRGGQSTKRSFKEAKRRVSITYGIYRKYGMSRLYWFHRWIVEMYKLVVG